jgi:hypothetical protein
MTERAAHLVDHVIPRVPVRQWMLTLPHRFRYHAELRRLGLGEQDQDGGDPLASASPALAACYAGSVTRRAALGPNAGKAIVKLGAVRNAPWVDGDKPRHGHYEGFDLHADVASALMTDRDWSSCCATVRAPRSLAIDRLSLAEDGRVVLSLKRRYHDGTSHLFFEPTTFIERLAALVPRPHKNLTVYSGCSRQTPSSAVRWSRLARSRIRRRRLSRSMRLMAATAPLMRSRSSPISRYVPTTPGPSSCAAHSPSMFWRVSTVAARSNC